MAKLQFLRNQTPLDSKDLALTGLSNYVEKAGSTAVDGEIVLARYYTDSSKTTIKTMYGIVSVISGKKSIDIFEDVSILGDYATKLDVSQTYIEKDSDYLSIEKHSDTYTFKGTDGQVLDTLTVPKYTLQKVDGLVETSYKLMKDSAQAGATITVPNFDSALLAVELTIKRKAANGTITNPTFNEDTKKFVAPSEDKGAALDVLAFAYSVKNGSTNLIFIDVADFLRESEFNKNDFKIDPNGGVVSLQEDRIKNIVKASTMPATNVTVTAIGVGESAVAGTNVQTVLENLNAKIEATSSAAIGIKAGNGISVTPDKDTPTLQNISVKIASGEALKADGNGLHLTASCSADSYTSVDYAEPVTSVKQEKGVVTFTKGMIKAENVKYVDEQGSFSGITSKPTTVEDTLSYEFDRIKELSHPDGKILNDGPDGGYISDIKMVKKKR